MKKYFLIFLSTFLFISCGDDAGSKVDKTGKEGYSCYENGTCDNGIYCNNDQICVASCINMECGIDHGVSCGTCGDNQECLPNNQCININTVQWGSESTEGGFSIITDVDGNIFVTGYTEGDLDGNINSGETDIFLTKFDNSGNKLWTKQWGTENNDWGNSVTTDSDGNIFVAGDTEGRLDGNINSGSGDIFLTKFDNEGNKLWTKQWGLESWDIGYSVTTDFNGNIFVTGYTKDDLDGNTSYGEFDIFLTKFDNSGNKLWTKQWGTQNDDIGNSVITDSNGNIFVTGYSKGDLDGNINLGDMDIFLTKFDNEGNELWTKQWGTEKADKGSLVVVDSNGNIFVTGYSKGDLDGNTNSGSYDIFLTKFDNEGNKLWTKQWGTEEYDEGKSVTIDSNGDLFVTGKTEGDLDGNINSGDMDIFLTKFDNEGNKLWTKQRGTEYWDAGNSVTIDSNGNIFVTGNTEGDLDGNANSAGYDIFLTIFNFE